MGDKVCIIGAGSSGLVAAKTLHEADIAFDCFELGSDIGGNWRQDNDNGRAAAYDSLHIDTSKDRMAFSDFPMPEHFPNYPHHSQVLEYFELYAERFGLKPLITFRTSVEGVEAKPEGGFRVEVRSLDSDVPEGRDYRAVLVCNGHHWSPRLPGFPGDFTGRSFHSRDFRSPRDLAGANVLVVGIGNSGADIACDAARVARRTWLSTRRGAHIVPRFLLGRPTDNWVTPAASRMPVALQRAVYRILIYLARGRQTAYGVPEPAHPLLAEHPTLSQDLLVLAANGELGIKPDVAELAGDRVRFTDGSEERVDVLIYATGYEIRFPFFDASLLDVEDNRIALYGRVIHPDRPGLYFVGLIQPLGAIMPLAELQAKWVAGLLTGRFRLPARRRMEASIERDRTRLARRYVASPRHTIQVDFFPYRRFLEKRLEGR